MLLCHCRIRSQVRVDSISSYISFLGPCKAGHYCDPNSSKELPCEEGTYNNITGLFNKSGCKTCPLNAYCPLGSPLPISCPSSNFFPARRTKVKIFEGKRSEDECRWCPVDPCDDTGKYVEYFQSHYIKLNTLHRCHTPPLLKANSGNYSEIPCTSSRFFAFEELYLLADI